MIPAFHWVKTAGRDFPSAVGWKGMVPRWKTRTENWSAPQLYTHQIHGLEPDVFIFPNFRKFYSKKLLDIVYNNLAFRSRWDNLTVFVYEHKYLQIKNRKRMGSVSNGRENIKISGKVNISRGNFGTMTIRTTKWGYVLLLLYTHRMLMKYLSA